MFSVIIGAVILLMYIPLWILIQYFNGKDDERCFICRRTVDQYNCYVSKDNNLDDDEVADVMDQMDDLPVLQVGNAFVPLCPICYELTFGFSTNPEEKATGVKLNLSTDTKYDFDARDD